ncbi:hypothetical protein MANES_18G099500v8 [Manihot esculenta]|uniref:Uncharacterized protein n=1 Tax=Manihot esculenta TaxID=3983 RepID=A0ACB7FZH3_MANES|nr:hypothetical protein MANES_18G099500v8 [Manihot esculenta]
MDFTSSIHQSSSLYPYYVLLNGFSIIPLSHFLFAAAVFSVVFLYNFLEFHLVGDFFLGFRGNPIRLTHNPSSALYNSVVSHCKILHGRQIYHASDGGTIALDWLTHSDVSGGSFLMNNAISKEDKIPIVVVIPGLSSDSAAAYIKHFAFSTAKRGLNVVVCNHRGLGGVSITSDCFYNAGWTEDIRVVINYLHNEYPSAPLFAVGTSIGANILVKYLGEDGERTHVAGAVAICNPWDLMIGDRFISRRLLQKFYDRVLAFGLQNYAKLHEPRFSRLATWEGIKKSRSVRDFNSHLTCHVGKFETVDTFYRRCSSSYYVGNVSVPLLCINALDDPLCTREAIPWDECRANKNIVLATPKHGGHLAFFEGLTGACLWWVRAVDEFLVVLHSSTCMHVQKDISSLHSSDGTAIDQGPYVNIAEDGMVASVFGQEPRDHVSEEIKEMISDIGQDDHHTETTQTSEQHTNINTKSSDVTAPVRKCLNQISRQTQKSALLLTRKIFPAAMLRR